MITIIHGDNIAASRDFLTKQKKLHTAGVTFDGEKVTLTDLTQVFSGGGLFSEEKAVFIDRLFTKLKKSDELDAILSYLQQQHDASIFIWEGKEVTKSTIKKLSDAKVQSFKLPTLLFQFLHSLKPKNSTLALNLFHSTIAVTDVEMTFAMLVRQVRILLAVKSDAQIDEVTRLAPWQRDKLKLQADTYACEKLVAMLSRLYTIDKNQKTGIAKQNLTTTIDFFLLDL